MRKDARLIVFAREPVAGRVKTRLIPALGAEGAASLYRTLAAGTLRWAVRLKPRDRADLEVRMDGGGAEALRGGLDGKVRFVSQGEGDLGRRMRRAFCAAFASGIKKAVLIGTDCPELSLAHFRFALRALRDADLVLGPTHDGGYCLIGLKEDCPALFEDMTWSTDEVLRQTVERAAVLGLRVKLLPKLQDIDLPSDLAFWSRVSRKILSVIIPALDEERDLPGTLAALPGEADIEVIIVDGGSRDDTSTIAVGAGAKVIRSQPGRARQMNAGAGEASGDILLFLHADTRLPAESARLIRTALRDPEVVGGSFALGFEPCPPLLRINEMTANGRSRLFKLPFGDQGIFVRASVFRLLGGFKDMALMEDVDFVRRLGRMGRLAFLRPPVRTSSRRYDRGILRTTLLNKAVFFGYFLGVPPARLARLYGSRGRIPGSI